MGTSHARPDGCQHLLQRHCVWAWRRWLAGGEPREVLLRGREHGLQHCRGKRRERSRCSVAHRFWMPGMRATRSKTVHVYCAMIADSAARPAARATTRSVSRLSRRSPGPGQFIHMSGGNSNQSTKAVSSLTGRRSRQHFLPLLLLLRLGRLLPFSSGTTPRPYRA